MNQRNIEFTATTAFLVIMLLFCSACAAAIEIDQTSTVTAVVDGSSFTLNSGQTIKLADISTPQLGQNGYTNSKNYLAQLVQGKTVYLDTHNQMITDQSGDLICVAYVDYNSSYYINVNSAMILNGYATPKSDYPQFNPVIPTSSWFVAKTTTTPIPTETLPTQTETPTLTPYVPSPLPTETPNLGTTTPSVPEFSALALFALLGILSAAILIFSRGLKKKGFQQAPHL